MAAPKRYKREYSFSGYQATTPAKPLPGPKVDNELENIEQSVNGTIASLALIQRSDGALRNGIVTNAALAPDLQTGVSPGEEWQADVQYAIGDVVFVEAAYYRCIVAHVGTIFADDLTAGYWLRTADLEPYLTSAVDAKLAPLVDEAINTRIPDQATAEAGVSNTALMTPLRAKQSVTANAEGATFTPADNEAIARPIRSKLRDTVSLNDWAPIADGTSDNRAKIQAAVDFVYTTGGELRVEAGAYRGVYASGDAVVTLDSTITAEPYGDRRHVSLVGDGAGSTVFHNASPNYMFKFTGGQEVEAHNYEVHRDFSVMGSNLSSGGGIHIFNKAYTGLENMTIMGCATALKLESVLSAVFKNLRLAWNAVGVTTSKGAGFSHVNAVHWDSCKFQASTAIGYNGGPSSHGLVFTNCNFEANGRQGQSADGGCWLSFEGVEGGVGATFSGGYFESNAGLADLVLVNSGPAYVTVVLNGVTFNRNIADRYTTNCIHTVGRIKLVLTGCAFKSYNGYVPNAGRQYIAGDSELILSQYACEFQDEIEAAGLYGGASNRFYGGRVAADGTAISLPDGWTSSKLGTGTYRVTHNLSTAAYGVTANVAGAAAFSFGATPGVNVFDVTTVDTSFAGTDAAFSFTLVRT